MESIVYPSATMADTNEKITSAELAKLWATYMGNTMSVCVLKYFLQHTEDPEIKQVVKHALMLSEQFVETIKQIFIKENFPIPIGFTEEDVNLGAPRLFMDEFYLHYLKYAGKLGMSIYEIAIPLATRTEIRDFFTYCLDATVKLTNQINDVLNAKGMLVKPPYIPIPDKVDFLKKQSYLNGFFGEIRPLQAMEITHLFDNLTNDITSKAILIAFSQTAKLQQIREFFLRGKSLTTKHIDTFSQLLHRDDLPSPPLMDHLVTDSTFAPFSDKLMVAHKLDMFSMRIRSYANGLSLNARHDVGAAYARFMVDVANYAEDGGNIMIDMGWLEQPPQSVDRNALAIK